MYKNVEAQPEQAQRAQQAIHKRHKWRQDRPLPRIPVVTPINASTTIHNGQMKDSPPHLNDNPTNQNWRNHNTP
jgi:hypothetical protein